MILSLTRKVSFAINNTRFVISGLKFFFRFESMELEFYSKNFVVISTSFFVLECKTEDCKFYPNKTKKLPPISLHTFYAC